MSKQDSEAWAVMQKRAAAQIRNIEKTSADIVAGAVRLNGDRHDMGRVMKTVATLLTETMTLLENEHDQADVAGLFLRYLPRENETDYKRADLTDAQKQEALHKVALREIMLDSAAKLGIKPQLLVREKTPEALATTSELIDININSSLTRSN